MEGRAIPLASVEDPAFSQKIMGEGIAIVPSVGKVYSPVDGVVDTLFETLHSLGLKSDEGVEVLIHVGRDTVGLKGRYFKAYVKQGDRVKKGDLLLGFDSKRIQKSGYDITTPITIVNTADFESVVPSEEGEVSVGAPLISIVRRQS
jgi:glucose-specific phosphotransferase system IIA component